MGTITLSRDDVEKLRGGEVKPFGGDDRLANFLVHRFDEEAEKARLRDEPTWVFNIWTYTF